MGVTMAMAKASTALTRKDLTEAVCKSVPALSRRDSSRILDEFFDEIVEALARDETVKLRGFGVFKIQNKKTRIGRNPKTGIDAVITPRRAVKFSASPYVRAVVNGETPPNSSDEEEA
jgi:integration host factor subunit alpha